MSDSPRTMHSIPPIGIDPGDLAVGEVDPDVDTAP